MKKINVTEKIVIKQGNIRVLDIHTYNTKNLVILTDFPLCILYSRVLEPDLDWIRITFADLDPDSRVNKLKKNFTYLHIFSFLLITVRNRYQLLLFFTFNLNFKM
jgi:hypothetical protein